jgi:hypothetical protein
MKLDQIYTYYINGVEPEEGIWGCVAKNEEEAPHANFPAYQVQKSQWVALRFWFREETNA